MKTIIGISNFSFNKSHFGSFQELNEQFSYFQVLKKSYKQAKVSFSIGTDITKDKYFGSSVEEQICNFEYGTDVGIQTAFRTRLHREYLNGFELALTTDELKEKALKVPDEENKENYILFTPVHSIADCKSYNNDETFRNYYEYILGHFPVDNESFYERVESHFTNLIYHPDCGTTLDRVTDGFCHYSIAFTTCLRALNDFSPTDVSSTRDKVRSIKALTNYDCTPENDTHIHFKFDFNHNKTLFSALDCQYHLKPSDRNIKGDGSFNQKRLYFGFIPINVTEWKIALASIGPHITKHDSRDRFAPQKLKRKKKKNKGNS
ncbi:Putative uncharacterized protein [Moritella viscosa]|uniref:hypothetical protein n=1 Tax=Moritella viscosa TaxID=80854 RepID=UPI0009154B7B|nr:hypothetical protein [Moritella viscosa]SGY86590.1 Putative uncharacterized protein [Moritella viscosa]